MHSVLTGILNPASFPTPSTIDRYCASQNTRLEHAYLSYTIQKKDIKKPIEYIDLVTKVVHEEYIRLKKIFRTSVSTCSDPFFLPNIKIQVQRSGKTTRPIRPSSVLGFWEILFDGKCISSDSWGSTVKIALITELIICVQYYHNQILDRKSNIEGEIRIRKNIEAANSLKDIVYQYIQYSFSKNEKQKVKAFADKAFLFVDIGQYLQIELNSYEAFQHPVPPTTIKEAIENLLKSISQDLPDMETAELIEKDKRHLIRQNIKEGYAKYGYTNTIKFEQISEEIERFTKITSIRPILKELSNLYPNKKQYIENYFKRIHLTCAALYFLSMEIQCQLFYAENATPPEDLLAFISTLGIMRQLVNDICDNIPSQFTFNTKTKTIKDAFSDLKNNNITLPITMYLESKQCPTIKKSMKHPSPNIFHENDEQSIFRDFIKSSSLSDSMSIARKISSIAENLLSSIYYNEENLGIKLFKYMLRISQENKFFKEINTRKSYLRLAELSKKQNLT